MRRRTTQSPTLSVTLREGKNREVRRVFARMGFKVIALERTDIGPLSTRGLKTGKWRALSRDEVESLLRLADGLEEDDASKDLAPAPKPRREDTLRRKRLGGATKKKAGKKVGAKKPTAFKKPARRKPEPDEPRSRRIVGPK